MLFQNKKMKLAACYSVFDGYELLEASILSIREAVDYIVVGYQDISYHNQPADKELKKTLDDLLNKGLIDELYKYNPTFSVSPTREERRKRRIGLRLAKKQKCNYYFTMDCDEFYKLDELVKAKNFILKNNIKSSVVPIMDYLAPNYQLGISNVCPFIFKINLFSRQKKVRNFPFSVDGTRCINTKKNFYKFTEEDIMMHHMRFVRKNIQSKYDNRSNAVDVKKKFDIMDHINNIKNYHYPNDFINIEDKKVQKVKKIDNFFKINL